MADLKNPLPDSGLHFWSIIAAVVGALLSLQFLVDSSHRVRFWSFLSALALALFTGPAVARWVLTKVEPGDFSERCIVLLIAAIGVNVLAGFSTFTIKWRRDPQEAFTWLWGILGNMMPWGRKP